MTLSIHTSGQRGFSIIELMVAVAISLIATLVIFETFAVSEGIKRTSTSGGDAQQNGAMSLYMVEREVRMAGYGINNAALLGCKIVAYDEVADEDLEFTLAPVVIEPGATDKNPDTITILIGDSDLLADPAKLIQAMPSPAATYKVDNRYGFIPGDLVVAVEAGKDCTLAQVTETPGTPGKSDNVIHNSGMYKDPTGKNVPARYNKPGGLGISYSTAGFLYNLGQMPQRNIYRIVDNRLEIERTLVNTDINVVTEQIVQMKAEYGKDDGAGGGVPNDGIVDSYSNSAPAGADGWRQVLAMRLAVVARSAQPEKPTEEGGACDITTAFPSWAGGNIDVSADDNWQCYRYRVFETVVPLRNLIWMQI